MTEIVKKIKALGFDEYGVVCKENENAILVFMGYRYYNELSMDCFCVSPYYFASNRAYFAAKELADYIKSLGFEAIVDNVTLYDDDLEAAGARRGKNNLFFIEGLGSLFCVHIIRTNAPIGERMLTGKECLNCGKCVQSCPMGALTKDGINPNRCLRHLMNSPEKDEAWGRITTLLGCDRCQMVCPNNAADKIDATYPQFEKKKMLQGDISGVADLVGKNMARKQRLMFQAMCAAANMGETELLSSFEENVPPALADVKKWCEGKLENIDLKD